MLSPQDQELLDLFESMTPEEAKGLSEEDITDLERIQEEAYSTPQEDKPLWSPEGSGWPAEIASTPRNEELPKGAYVQPMSEYLLGGDIVKDIPRGANKLMAKAVGAVGSIPSTVGAIDFKNPFSRYSEFPYIELKGEEASKLEEDNLDNYNRILQDPNFLEEILTDPTLLIPGVGELKIVAKLPRIGAFLAKYGRPALDALVQTASEVIQGKITTPGQAGATAAVGSVAGTVLGAAGRKAGDLLSSGADESLARRLMLKPKNQLYPQGTDVRMLLEDKQVPLTGGSEGIFNKLSETVKGIGRDRDAILKNMGTKRTMEKINHNLDLEQHAEDTPLGDFSQLDLEGALDGESALKSVKAFRGPIEAHAANKPVLAPSSYEIMPKGDLTTEATRVYRESTQGRALNDVEKKKIWETIQAELDDFEYGGQGTPTLKDLIARRGRWADKGKVGTKDYDELTTAQSKAYALLSKAGSALLNKDPAVAAQNKLFSRYLPTLDAMEEKIPAWSNRTGERIDITKPGTWASAPWNSNASLVGRYAAGGVAPKVGSASSMFAIPAVSAILTPRKPKE
jgi:hypothetical protein